MFTRYASAAASGAFMTFGLLFVMQLLIELQLRTRLQHEWATAVETMGTFLQSSLKSSQGPEEWLDFFSLFVGTLKTGVDYQSRDKKKVKLCKFLPLHY